MRQSAVPLRGFSKNPVSLRSFSSQIQTKNPSLVFYLSNFNQDLPRFERYLQSLKDEFGIKHIFLPCAKGGDDDSNIDKRVVESFYRKANEVMGNDNVIELNEREPSNLSDMRSAFSCIAWKILKTPNSIVLLSDQYAGNGYFGLPQSIKDIHNIPSYSDKYAGAKRILDHTSPLYMLKMPDSKVKWPQEVGMINIGSFSFNDAESESSDLEMLQLQNAEFIDNLKSSMQDAEQNTEKQSLQL